MKPFFMGLALGFGIGLLLLPKSGNEHDELLREKTRELQRSLPQTGEREVQSAALHQRRRFTRARRPQYGSHAGAVRAGIHPIVVLNTATEKELLSAGVEPELVAKIVAGRPYTSLHDAMDRGLLPRGTLAMIQQVAQDREPLPLQPIA